MSPESQTQTHVKLIVIGRHKFTNKQLSMLKTAFGEFKVIQQLTTVNLNDANQISLMNNAEAVIIQALPIDILAKLLRLVKKPIYMFKVEAVAVVKPEEAEEVAKKYDADIINLDPRSGNARIARTVALQRVKRIVIETEDVVR